MRTTLVPLLLAVLPSAAVGQDAEFSRPPEWRVRFDRPTTSDSALYFVSMPPGWHVTSGPAGILYDPARTARGEYRVRSEIFLFPGDRREGFGIFIGGRDLDNENQSYTYFLIRKDGRFLVKDRRGRDTNTLVPWTAHAAILQHPGGDQTAKNVLAVRCGTDTVEFYVNDAKVASLPRSAVLADGVVGLRVNHSLNLHITDLTVERGGGDG